MMLLWQIWNKKSQQKCLYSKYSMKDVHNLIRFDAKKSDNENSEAFTSGNT